MTIPNAGPVQTGTDGQGNPIYSFYAPPGDGRRTAWVNVNNFYSPQDQGDAAPAFRRALAWGAGEFPRGFTLYVPSGVYTLASVVANPSNAGYSACFFLPSGVCLQGDGPAATTLQLGANLPDLSYALMNLDITTGGDTHVCVRDMAIDGNAANQNAATGIRGPDFLRVRDQLCFNVTFRNFLGTATSGSGETFHLHHELSSDITVLGCLVEGTAGQTASGFSADGCNNVHYGHCVARGMTLANGFTHNTCAGVVHDACYSYLNGSHGFNSEVSAAVAYDACVAGGKTNSDATYPFAAGSVLGNSGYGFVCNGSVARYANCEGSQNGGTNGDSGLTVLGAGGAARVMGGRWLSNQYHGMHVQSPGVLYLEGVSEFSGNGLNDILDAGGGAAVAHGVQTAPAIPASATAYTSPFPMACAVYVSGGTVTAIAVEGTATGLTAGAVRVPAGGTITLTYSVAPAWVWVAD